LLDIDSVEIAGSSSLDSMDEPDVLNEGTRDEDETKTEDEVRRLVQHEAIYPAAQDQIADSVNPGGVPRRAPGHVQTGIIRFSWQGFPTKPRITSPQTNVDFGRVKQPLPIRFEVR
jgi:hypothetical protein